MAPFHDICPYCDGTGEDDPISGARCYECDGTGMIDDDDDFCEYEDYYDELEDE